MAHFQLVISPDGHALLTTPESLSEQQLVRLRALLKDWQERKTLGVLADTDVVLVSSIDIDLRPRTDA